NGPTSGAGNTPGGPPAGSQFYFWPPAATNDLLRYSTIIWHAGSLNQFTITPTDQALIQSWIQQPGKSRNLYLIGDNVAWEMIVLGQNYNGFLDFTMGARYLRNVWEDFPQDTLHPIITGYTGSPTAGRLMHANSDCPLIEDFDLIATSNGAPARGKSGNFLRYPNNFPAATRFATKYTVTGSDSARTVLQAFNFNNIEEGGERIRLIKNVMTDYFQVPACYYPTAVEDDPTSGAPPLPDALFQNAPNPFNPETTIRYSLSSPGWATIRIFNAGGALVRTLVDRHHAAGVYTARWDGKDDGGHRLSSGVYFYKLQTASGTSAAKKLLMLK
ncbi:MAG: FlgD immunoglobulin-like domain containing protein, partial [Candidatus Eiseniibacteriota bacterium]